MMIHFKQLQPIPYIYCTRKYFLDTILIYNILILWNLEYIFLI